MKKLSLLPIIIVMSLILAGTLSSCVSEDTQEGTEPVVIEEGSPVAILLTAYDKIADAGSYLVEVTTVTSMTLNGQANQSDNHMLIAATTHDETVDIHMMSWSTRQGEDNIVTSYYKDGQYYTDAGGQKVYRAMGADELVNYDYGTAPAVPITEILSQDAADAAETEGFEDIEDGILLTFTLNGTSSMENLNMNIMSAVMTGTNRNFAMSGVGDMRPGQGRDGSQNVVTGSPVPNAGNPMGFNMAGMSPAPDFSTFTQIPSDGTVRETAIEYTDVTAWALLDGDGNLISVWLEAIYTMNFMGQETPVTVSCSYDFLKIGDITVSFPDDLDKYELMELPQAQSDITPLPTPKQ